jgi:hypothetical protein
MPARHAQNGIKQRQREALSSFPVNPSKAPICGLWALVGKTGHSPSLSAHARVATHHQCLSILFCVKFSREIAMVQRAFPRKTRNKNAKKHMLFCATASISIWGQKLKQRVPLFEGEIFCLSVFAGRLKTKD